MKVLEVIQLSATFLARKNVEAPRLQVELMLGHVLRMPRLKLYLEFDRELDTAQLDELRAMVQRRSRREPLQHILGSTSFCGHEIKVSREVLIPRPETELLAERACLFLNHHPSAEPFALDFGTGSGCLAIALALGAKRARVHALDVSPAALALARENTELNQARVDFSAGDGFSALPDQRRFDLIVSNPPYIASAEIETLSPEVRDHDPRLALDGGADGLDFYRRLAGQAPARLNPGGTIMMEFGDGQADAIRGLFERAGWTVNEVMNDYSGRARILIAQRAES